MDRPAGSDETEMGHVLQDICSKDFYLIGYIS